MATLMMQFRHVGAPPTLAEVGEMFGLVPGELDPSFGVVATDPGASLFTVLVEEAAHDRVRQRLASRPLHPGEGLFANVEIAPTATDDDV